MKRKVLNIILLIIILTSGLSAKVPKWVKNNSHPDYPADEYFIGIGISSDRTEAEDLARANLIKEISVKIESELENIESETIKNGKVDTKSEINQKIKTVVEANLVGVQIAALEQDKETYYALAVLSRLKYFTTLEIKMEEIGGRIKNLINDSNNLQEEGLLLSAVKNYRESAELLADYSEKSDLYTALTGKKYAVLKTIDSTSIQLSVQKIVTNTKLTIYRGAEQTGISGNKLPEPVIVKAIYKTPLHKEVPVQNLPIQIAYENGDRIDNLITGTDGKIKIDITAVPTDETGKQGAVVFKALFEKVKGNLPEITMTYLVETTKVTYSVKIDNPVLQKKITAMIAENGYSVSNNGDFIITANSSVVDKNEIESPFGNMFMVKVEANLNMKEKSSGKTIASMKATGRATDKSSEKAQDSAYGKIKIIKKDFIAFLAKAID